MPLECKKNQKNPSRRNWLISWKKEWESEKQKKTCMNESSNNEWKLADKILCMCEILTEYWFFLLSEIDDEGIERDSEDIDDEKFLDTKELDHILEVSC